MKVKKPKTRKKPTRVTRVKPKIIKPRKRRRQTPTSPIRTVATAGIALYGAGAAVKVAGRLF